MSERMERPNNTGKKEIWKCAENHEVVIAFADKGEPNAYAISCKYPKCKQTAYPSTGEPGVRLATYEWYKPANHENNARLLSEEQLQDVRNGLLLLRRIESPRLNNQYEQPHR
jgi:hypothetical protein